MCLLIYHLEPKLSSNAVQTIFANKRMNVQLNIQLSQGSAATNVRGSGKFYASFTCGSYRNTTLKELLKSVHICQSYPKNITWTFFMAHGVHCQQPFRFLRHTSASVVSTDASVYSWARPRENPAVRPYHFYSPDVVICPFYVF